MIAQQLEAVAGMHRASELFSQPHNSTWHAQEAIAHEVALLVRADDDLGWRRSGQGRPAGDRGQALVGAPIAVGSIVQPNARARRAAPRAWTQISHGLAARVPAFAGEGTGATCRGSGQSRVVIGPKLALGGSGQ